MREEYADIVAQLKTGEEVIADDASFPGNRLWTRSLTCRGHTILSVLLTFRSFTTELSRIATVLIPENPMRAPQFFRIGSGHRAGSRPLASSSVPTNQLRVGTPFRGFIQSFAFAAALRFARRPG